MSVRIWDAAPLWAIFFAVVAMLFLSIEIGRSVGKYRLQKGSDEKVGLVGSMAGAVLGMFAFLLAFTFNMAANRLQERQQLVLNEANAITTCYLRAGLLADPVRSNVRQTLTDYLGVRLRRAKQQNTSRLKPEELKQLIDDSESLLRKLWQHAVAAKEDPSARMFIPLVNQVVELHNSRVSIGIHKRIPVTIWIALSGIAFFAFGGMGYHIGLSNPHRPWVIAPVVCSFAVVILLIVGLDGPQYNLIRVSQQALLDAQQQIEGTGP